MKLQTLEMPKNEARKAFLDYRDVLREGRQKQSLQEDEQIMRCYRALSQGKQVIDLNEVMREAGETDTGLPRLAISRADYEKVEMRRDWRTGSVTLFPDGLDLHPDGAEYEGRVFRFPNVFSVRLEPGVTQRRRNYEGKQQDFPVTEFTAIVPNIPPRLRPDHALSNYHLLFEVTWKPRLQPVRAPKDPALLKHLGGPLYAVLATWDLTPVEQAVLGVTRS